MNLTPAQNGFIKGVILPVAAILVAYFSNPEHLTFLSAGTALLVSGLLSSVESYIKMASGRGLFGVSRVD